MSRYQRANPWVGSAAASLDQMEAPELRRLVVQCQTENVRLALTLAELLEMPEPQRMSEYDRREKWRTRKAFYRAQAAEGVKA